MKFLLKRIKDLDKKSEEFFDLYHAINDKYWDIDEEDLDDYARSARLLNLISNRGEDYAEEVMATAKIANELLTMAIEKKTCINGVIGFKGKKYHFRFSDSPDSLDNLQKMMNNTVIVKAKEEQTDYKTR